MHHPLRARVVDEAEMEIEIEAQLPELVHRN
jgi:hypothetical protein